VEVGGKPAGYEWVQLKDSGSASQRWVSEQAVVAHVVLVSRMQMKESRRGDHQLYYQTHNRRHHQPHQNSGRGCVRYPHLELGSSSHWPGSHSAGLLCPCPSYYFVHAKDH
jgi:hypothetical protein